MGRADGGGQPPHPVHLFFGGDDVLTGRPCRRQLEHASAELSQRAPDAEQLVLCGVGPRNRLSVDGQVGKGPRRRETERSGADRLLDHLLHGLDVLGRGRLVASPPIAHHVGAHRAVSDLGPEIHCPLALVEGVEILREGLPLPFHALGQGTTGNVLDPFHQPDQPLVAIRTGWSEPDAAVTGDHGGHAVRTAWSQDLVPRGLPVVVGVDVHPARRYQQSVGVDGPGCRFVGEGADTSDLSPVHGHVGRASRSAGAVDDRSPPNHEVVHGRFPLVKTGQDAGMDRPPTQ